MFCLRSWLPLLFIPTNASPIFVLTFFLLTYYLNRPCVYCSILLAILFASSCYWSESCWFDGGSSSLVSPEGLLAAAATGGGSGSGSIAGGSNKNASVGASAVGYAYSWFEPRYISSTIPNPLAEAGNGFEDVDGGEMSFLAEVVNSTIWGLGGAAVQGVQKSGIGLGWVRSLLGGAEWRVPLLGVDVRL